MSTTSEDRGTGDRVRSTPAGRRTVASKATGVPARRASSATAAAAPSRPSGPAATPSGPTAARAGAAPAAAPSRSAAVATASDAASAVAPTAAPRRTVTATAQPGRTTRRTGPRRVRISVSRLDPFSVWKMALLLSVAAGLAMVVTTALLWMLLNGLGVFNDLNGIIGDLTNGSSDSFDLMKYIGFPTVVSGAILLGVFNALMFMAIATLTAILYNICASLVGGAEMTLSDD